MPYILMIVYPWPCVVMKAVGSDGSPTSFATITMNLQPKTGNKCLTAQRMFFHKIKTIGKGYFFDLKRLIPACPLLNDNFARLLYSKQLPLFISNGNCCFVSPCPQKVQIGLYLIGIILILS